MQEPAKSNQEFPPLDPNRPMWWQDSLVSPLGFAQDTVAIRLGDLLQVALESSPLVKSILAEPMIRQADVVVADAEFDSTVFLDAKFTDTNDPVGNSLTTGDQSDRFRDETLTTGMGLRKRTRNGGQFEISQRGGFQENNSIFLDPNPQATTRLEVNFTQPLMRDRGRAINNVRILLAQLDVHLANSQVRSDLEKHLISVTTAYWDLYQARAEWLQRNRLLQGAQHLQQVIESRGGVDTQRRQILRAQAAVKSRQSELVRTAARVRNAQAQLRLLTGSPQLINAASMELTPIDQPLGAAVHVSTRDSVVTALDNRADVAESIRRIQAVSARVGAAKNQVLPKLDLILSGYAAGLNANRSTLNAWENQYQDGRPTYAVGFVYELPVRNRASKARLNRNRWEFSQAMHQFHQTMEVTFTEVEVAVRETETAYAEMAAKQQSVDAAGNEVLYLQERWDFLPDPNESAILLIEDLLDAQERLADEERAFVAAQIKYAMSWIQLRKTMGVLLRFDAPTTPDLDLPQPQPMINLPEPMQVISEGEALDISLQPTAPQRQIIEMAPQFQPPSAFDHSPNWTPIEKSEVALP